MILKYKVDYKSLIKKNPNNKKHYNTSELITFNENKNNYEICFFKIESKTR